MSVAIEQVLALARKEIRALAPYSHASWAPALTRLHANESPWPNNSADGEPLNRYPEPQPAELIAALANYLGVHNAQLLATHGSDEAIDLLTRVFCRAGQDAVIVTPPTFGMFAVAAHIQGAEVREVPLRGPDFDFDTAAVCAAVDRNVKIVWLCSPNNPTGRNLADQEIEAVVDSARGHALVVIDEAYAEFSQRPSRSNLLEREAHVAIIRTLSKAHGLAGARIGAICAHPEVIRLLRKVIMPYNLSRSSVATAVAAMQPMAVAAMRDRVRHIVRARDALARDLDRAPDIERVWPSDANFLLVRCRPDSRLFDRWVESGLLVRDFRRAPGLSGCLRITVGSEEQNARLRAVLGVGT